MRPTLAKWLELKQPQDQTAGVDLWLDKPLPPISHRIDQYDDSSAFVLFNENSKTPTNDKNTLLVSNQLRPQFEAQLVYQDLPKITREWSLCYHKDVIDQMSLCGVTGTNGKSSVTHFFAHIASANSKLGNIAKLGTLGLETSSSFVKSPNTTPFPLDLHPMLDRVHRDGDRCMIMEASSHALDQGRLEGLSFDVAGFTNLTQDHLDYHETMEHLFAAKSKIFDLCHGKVLINLDCEWVSKHKAKENVISYSTLDPSADLYAETLQSDDSGFQINIHFGDQVRSVYLPLLGEFNISNILCALGMALVLDESALDQYCEALESIQAPKGRLQRIDCPAKGRVIIDYAHTPDALESVLKTMRSQVKKGKLKVLFGCGGNRDNSKRAMMGAIASKYADYIYLTSDNPRFEEPDLIIDDIEEGILKGSKYERITSREEALKKALKELEQDELILLCGKGHETTQEIRGKKFSMIEEDLCQQI